MTLNCCSIRSISFDYAVVVMTPTAAVILDTGGNLLRVAMPALPESRCIGRLIAINRCNARWLLTLDNLGLQYQLEVSDATV